MPTGLCIILDHGSCILIFMISSLILNLFSIFHAFLLCLCTFLLLPHLNSIAKAGGQSGENRLNSIDRLHLWQVFFANPNEWWDQRKRKKNPNQPDFKHKDTGEALWLKKYDPPWVTRQLELLDSNIAEGGFAGRRSRVAAWVYDE
jgi:hypothetical protein